METVVVEIVPKQRSQQVYVVVEGEEEVPEGSYVVPRLHQATALPEDSAAVISERCETAPLKKKSDKETTRRRLLWILLLAIPLLVGAVGGYLYFKDESSPRSSPAPPDPSQSSHDLQTTTRPPAPSTASRYGSHLYVESLCYTPIKFQNHTTTSSSTDIVSAIEVNNTEASKLPFIMFLTQLTDEEGMRGGTTGQSLSYGNCNASRLPQPFVTGHGLQQMRFMSLALPPEYPSDYQVVINVFRAYSPVSEEDSTRGEPSSPVVSLHVSDMVLDFCDQAQRNDTSAVWDRLERDTNGGRHYLLLSQAALYGSPPSKVEHLAPISFTGLTLGRWRYLKNDIRGFRIQDPDAYRRAFLFAGGSLRFWHAPELGAAVIGIDAKYLGQMLGKDGPVSDKKTAALLACSFIELIPW